MVVGGIPLKHTSSVGDKKLSQQPGGLAARAFLTGRLLDVALGLVGKGGDAVNALAPIAGGDGVGMG